MTHLSLAMLGTWQVTLNGEIITAFESDKVRALLAYLAVESNRPQRRETLAALLWPERPERNARQNLSQALYNLRLAIGDRQASPPFLNITQQTIQFNHAGDSWLDVTAFTNLLAACEQHQHDHPEGCDACLERMQQAISLYQGDFLEGFSVSDSVTFDEWLLLEREQLHRQVLEALNHLINAYEGRGLFDFALPYAWRQVEVEPWNEEGQQQLIRLLARSGRRSEALSQFEKCRQLLWDELGVEPAAETQILYEAIRSEQLDEAGGPLVIRAKRRNQLILLDKVETFWVKGILGESLTGNRPVRITKQRYNKAVEQPWDELVDPGDEEEKPFPPGKTMGEIFAEADQSLLVLGAPGAGKTNALLRLARDRIAQARLNSDEPVPVVLNLASWGEGRSTIAAWVMNELTSRYQIPRRMGRVWLANQELLLLFDGFDEVSEPFREACIAALNRFRVAHGLTGIVVCSRTEAYEACKTRLNLGGAILLRPLTLAQIDAFLAAGGRSMAMLRTALRRDQTLQELAQTPLMLGVMSTVYSGQDTTTQMDTVDSTAPHHQLLQAYVQQVLHRRPISSNYSPAQIWEGLAWLARQMGRSNQSLFLIEQIQPGWLATKRQRWIYLITSRLVTGFLIGLVSFLLFLMARLVTPDVQTAFERILVARILPVSSDFRIFVYLIFINLGLGLVVAVIDDQYFESRLGREDEARLDSRQGRRHRAFVGLVVGFLATLLNDPTVQPLQSLGAGFIEAALFTLSNYSESSPGYRTEIRTVEALSWSWYGAVRRLVPGLIGGLVVGLLSVLLYGIRFGITTGLIWVSVFFLIGGLRSHRVEKKSLPNQGIRLSAKNSIMAALAFGVALGLPLGLIFGRTFGVLAGFMIGLGAAGLYGGQDVLKHFLVRLLLWLDGRTPRNYAHFLDAVAGRGLLYKVGGGYIFIHQLFQDYFALVLPDSVNRER